MPEQDEFFKPDTDFIPDEGPEQNIPDEGPEQPGMIDSAKNYLHSLAAEHPVARELIQRALTGTSPEFEAIAKSKGIDNVQGPGMMEIPGVTNITNKIEHAIDPTDSPFYTGLRPLAAGAAKLVGDTLASGFDPRTAGVKTPSVKLNPVDKATLDARLAAIATEDSPKKFYKPVKGLLPERSQATDFIADERGNVLPNQPTAGPLGETVSPDVAINAAVKPEVPKLKLKLTADGKIIPAEPVQTGFTEPDLPTAAKPPDYVEPPLPGREPVVAQPVTAETPKSVEIPKGTGKLTLKNPDPADVAGLKSQGYVVTNQTSKSVTLSNSPKTVQAAKALEVSDFTDKPSLSTKASEILKNFINETSGEFNPGKLIENTKKLFRPEPPEGPEGQAAREYLNRLKFKLGEHFSDLPKSISDIDPKQLNFIQEIAKDRIGDAVRVIDSLKDSASSSFHSVGAEPVRNVVSQLEDLSTKLKQNPTLETLLKLRDKLKGGVTLSNIRNFISDTEGALKPTELANSIKKLLRLKGKTADEVSTIREGIISGITREGRLDIPRVFNSVSSKISRPQFDKILNDIIESGDLTRLAAERRAKNLARDTSPMQMSPSEESPVSRLLDAVRQHTGARQEQDLLVSQEKARRFSNVESAPGTGVSRFFNQAQKLKGAYPKVDVSAIREAMSSVDMDSLMDMADQSSALKTTGERFRTKMAIGRVLGLVDKPGALQPNEIELLSRTYGPELANQLVELHGGLGAVAGNKAWGAVKEVNNLARTLWTSLDFSAPLRQGQGLMLNKEYLPAFKEMFKYGWSEKNYADLIEHLNTRPNAELGRKSGLFISNVITDSPSLKEEMYLSKLAEKIPGVRGSERAYTGFLDKLRADIFDRMIDDAQKAGVKTHDVIKYNSGGQELERIVPTQFSKDLAKYINRASGRGSLGKIGAFSDVLSTAGFSPRYQASRVQMLGAVLNPETYVKLDPAIRRQYLKSMLALGGMVGTSVGMSRLLGHGVSLDPRSSDFMKGRFGERTRQDAGASYLQYITLAARLATNQTTDQNGDTKLLDRTNKDGSVRKDEHEGVSGRLNVLGRFARSKESPLLSFVHDWINQKDYLGRPFSANKALADRFVPAVIQDVMALKDEDPDLLPMLNDNWTPTMTGATKPELLPLAVPSMFGVNSSVYDNPQNR